jgi:tRNA(Arg) A34 adenosine deaminase TadA
MIAPCFDPVAADMKEGPMTASEKMPFTVDPTAPLLNYWRKPVAEVASVDMGAAAPDLTDDAVKERHRIFCFLLMAIIRRFWNGNKRGPMGLYPAREKQKLASQDGNLPYFRYKGDMLKTGDNYRINWDRYLGHNIACIAVDGNGEVIDFDFNHNDFFRSSAEHAEARMVRRLFSLTSISDGWKTGQRIPERSRAFSLKEVTLYTSLESCAQCSGIMSLGRVKQVIFLQNDPGTYAIGNIMYNLAGSDPSDQSSMSPLPIPSALVGLAQFDALNAAYANFCTTLRAAKAQQDKTHAFYVSPDQSTIDYESSITSFLCTDAAYDIFDAGTATFETLTLKHPNAKNPAVDGSWTNAKCLEGARQFYKYADVEGFRGSPHRV